MQTRRTPLARLGLSIVLASFVAPLAHAGTLYSEAATGDLSGNNFAPTKLGTLTLGSNVLSGVTGGGDRDYFTITVGAGQTLSAITLVTYQSNDGRSFLGVMSGATFSESPAAPNVANMLGYTHFGFATAASQGTNILDDLATGAGAIGFPATLGPGTYSFWLQQLGATTTYGLDFVVVPSPAPMAMLLGVAGIATRRRR
ncbi:MAG: hypothetical protein SFY96_08555 [Planctomycetota bacterium]|nr:hypothetical protein [Planctomycetota bacterium]